MSLNTAIESIIADACHAVGDVDGSQFAAIIKSSLIDTRYSINDVSISDYIRNIHYTFVNGFIVCHGKTTCYGSSFGSFIKIVIDAIDIAVVGEGGHAKEGEEA